jgi:hypothetical protein
LDRPQCPLFRRREGRVDEGFTEIDLSAITEIFGEPLQEPIESAAPLPLLKPPMARLVRWVPIGQIRPWRAGAQYPQNAVHHGARVAPGATAPVGPATRPERRLEKRPLLIGQIHAATYDAAARSVTGRITYL